VSSTTAETRAPALEAEGVLHEVPVDATSDDARLLASLRADPSAAWIAAEALRALRRRFSEADDVELPSSASMLVRRVRSVLQRGPSTDHEHALARAIAAIAVAANVDAIGQGSLDDLARELLLLARDTPWDATGLLDAATGAGASDLWSALIARLRILVERADPAAVRSELLVGTSALLRSAHPVAIEGMAKLAATVRDPAVRGVLCLGEAHQAPVIVEGSWTPTPPAGVLRALLVLTGFTIVRTAWHAFEHTVLGRRRHARVEWRSGRLLVTHSDALGGRSVSHTTLTLAPDAIARIDWSGKRNGLVGGMFVALVAAGTFAGTFFAVVGARLHVASFFSGGVGLAGLALLLDQAPLRLLGALGGRGRLTIVPRDDEPIVIEVRQSETVDALLQRWASASH
jgi:hypothetical protein